MKANNKKSVKKKVEETSNYNDLFVAMSEPKLKRKYLLLGVKNALVMQEELDKIQILRKEKHRTLNEIKKNLEAVNDDYQLLKKLMPNVKNILSITETELSNLESEIELLKSDIKSDQEQIEIDERLKESILGVKVKKKDNYEEIRYNQKPIGNMAIIPNSDKKNVGRSISKLDRIQNNLKVIESKLNDL